MKELITILVIFLSSIESRRNVRITTKESNSVCSERNGFYPVQGKCDAYIECKDFKPHEKLCPDGLLFKPDAPFRTFPCVYPIDAVCIGLPAMQQAQSTRDCPRRYGFFPIKHPKDCGLYRNCVEGRAYDLRCPEGLAYDPTTYRCEWPNLVEGCDVENFLGFHCPGPIIESDESSEVVQSVNYKHPSDCKKYFICVGGKPRLLSCGADEVFDEFTGRCEEAETAECIITL